MTASFCIIVGYRPNVARLYETCRTLARDGAVVVVVDNTENPYLDRRELPESLTLITLGYNSGIAHAQNVGIAAARDLGATMFLFLDQDSKIEPGFLKRLGHGMDDKVPQIVSPLCIDEVSGASLPAVRIDRIGMPRPVHEPTGTQRYPVDIVISSGIMVTRPVFEIAGIMDEALFIDLVDTEWCLRCRARQIPIHVDPRVVMRHSIGSRQFRFGPLTISVHSATRCYYQIRNCLLLFRRSHVPRLFAVRELAATLLSRSILLMFVEGRGSYLKAYFSAIRDGIRGTTGVMPAR